MTGIKSSPFVQERILEKALVRNYKSVKLYRVGWTELADYTRFVYGIYTNSSTDDQAWELTSEDLRTMHYEDQTYFPHSAYFAFMNPQDQILGTIKVTQKSELVLLPTEVEYQMDLKALCKEWGIKLGNIWHAGRLAVDKRLLKQTTVDVSSRQMFLELVCQAFIHICQHPKGVFLAEADKRVMHLFRKVGINMQQVGKGKMYLGSETYPVMIAHQDMLAWLDADLLASA